MNNMSDELTITTSLDQSLLADAEEELTVVEYTISKAIRERDIGIAIELCKKIRSGIQVKGLALAKAFYLIERNWEEFQIADDFYDSFYTYIGVHRETVVRYIRVWEMLQLAPPEIAKELQNRNIKDLIPIGHAISQGYEIEPDEWEELAKTDTFQELSNVLKEIKGQESRKSSLTLMIDRDGSIWAYSKDDSNFVGSLELDDERVEKAVNRIVDRAGIIRK